MVGGIITNTIGVIEPGDDGRGMSPAPFVRDLSRPVIARAAI
jgi:hypothetical protein